MIHKTLFFSLLLLSSFTFAAAKDTSNVEWIKTYFNSVADKNVESGFESMTFDQMIKKIETKKVLKQENQFFKDLNHLRKLRNRIHLQETKTIGKTDYYSFWIPEYNLSKKNLLLLLLDEIFIADKGNIELFEFLKT